MLAALVVGAAATEVALLGVPGLLGEAEGTAQLAHGRVVVQHVAKNFAHLLATVASRVYGQNWHSKEQVMAEINLALVKIYNDSGVILFRIERVFHEGRSHS